MAMVRCGLAIRSGWSRYQQCDRALGGSVGRLRSSPQLQVCVWVGPGGKGGGGWGPNHGTAGDLTLPTTPRSCY